MRETVTISIPKSLRKKLDEMMKNEQLNRSDIIREALRQYIAKQEFRRLRNIMVPQAEKQGIYTDEDVFQKIS